MQSPRFAFKAHVESLAAFGLALFGPWGSSMPLNPARQGLEQSLGKVFQILLFLHVAGPHSGRLRRGGVLGMCLSGALSLFGDLRWQDM